MHCPFCNAEKEALKVIDSRTCEGGRAIRRRRECLKCNKRFTTYERVEENVKVMVIKRDGRRLPWDRQKILTGLERACFKRPVPESELMRIVDEVEEEIFRSYDREVQSAEIGEAPAGGSGGVCAVRQRLSAVQNAGRTGRGSPGRDRGQAV
jgi:transcriptional repressor NrdR